MQVGGPPGTDKACHRNAVTTMASINGQSGMPAFIGRVLGFYSVRWHPLDCG